MDLPDGMRRLAETVSVLCGKYSSTLRKVQFKTPQGGGLPAAAERPETGKCFQRKGEVQEDGTAEGHMQQK